MARALYRPARCCKDGSLVSTAGSNLAALLGREVEVELLTSLLGLARHICDIEAIYRYEGTETVQALIVGRDITGHNAFVPTVPAGKA
jgi:alkylation response protein AidB-like acyl-CoA dehydrogenase